MARAAAILYADAAPRARALARLRPWICPFERLVELVPTGARVLDVGCGNGLLLGLLARAGRISAGIGIDADARAIAAAERMRARLPAPRRLIFLRQDAQAPWPAGPFQAVTAVDLLHHVPPEQQRALVERACMAVAPGGLLLYKDMVARPRWRAAANHAHDLVMARQWIHHRALDEVIAWASAAGMTLERQARIDRWWYGHELAAFRRTRR